MKTFSLSAVAAIALSIPTFAQTYQVTDIGLLNGAPTYAAAISDDGVVCGYALPDAVSAKAWVFASNTLTELPGLGGSDTRALAVAANGAVFGYSTDAGGLAHAVRWDAGVVTDLGPVSGPDGWFPQSVNASGTVVGFSGSSTTPALGFQMDGTAFVAIGTLMGATSPATGAAFDINDAGRIVGFSSWVGGGTRAFRTDATGQPVSLGTLGANDSTAMSVNGAGDVAGYSVNATNGTRAFVFTDSGGMRDLGVLAGHVESRAYAINDTGLAVGTSVDALGNGRAFVWGGSGALLDLNPLIPPNSGWVLNEAQDINGGGDIVGTGSLGGISHAFIIERFEGLDTLAPIVSAIVPVTNGSPASVVTMNYWDNEKVVADTTHGFGTVRVSGPNGYEAVATQQSYYSTDRQSGSSTFSFVPPGGSWNGADNGTYEIRLAPNFLSDLAGNKHPGGVIGTFTVGIQTVPTLALSGLPTTTTTGTPVNLTITASGSYPAAAGDLFSVAIDWDGDGSDLQTVNAATNSGIPHTFTAIGTHTVRVTVTDPHGLTSSERTASISVANSSLPVLSEVIGASLPGGVTTNLAAATIQGGKLYLFGTQPWDNFGEEIPIYTWNFLPGGVYNPNAPFVSEGNMNIGPLTPDWAAVDSRNRVIVYRAAGGSVYSSSSGVGASIAPKPTAFFSGANAVDNLSRYYSFYAGVLNYRYDAGASGAGTWTQLPTLPAGFSPSAASFDGAGRIIIFGGTSVYALDIAANTLAQLPNTPYAFTGSATLGADGFIYLTRGTEVWTFNPTSNSISLAGSTSLDHSTSPAVLAGDGFIYLIGGYNAAVGAYGAVSRIDTRAGFALRAPRISTTPTGTTSLSVGTAWTYTAAASGKPAPAFSIVSGPPGLTISAGSGLVSWTPASGQVGVHRVRIRAANSAGVAEQLIILSVLGTAPDTTAPTAVTGLMAFNIGLNSVDLAWNTTTDNVGVTGYRVMEKRTSGNRWHRTTYYYTLGTTTGLSWHLGGLPTGTVKTYYVSGIDAAGNQGTPTPVTVALIAPPSISANQSGTFAGVRAIVSEPWTGNTVTASGNPMPTLSAGSFPAGAVWHSTASNSGYFTWTAAAGQEGTQTFTVNASNSGGTAGFSQTVTVYPAGTDLIPPSGVGSLVIDQLSFDSCRATWTAATDNYGISLYHVAAIHREPRRRFHHGAYNDHVVAFDVPPGNTQAVINGLRPSTNYVVSVTAMDTSGQYGYSTTRDIRTLLQPFVVASAQTTTISNGDGSSTIAWPGYGYYYKFTVECSTDLVTWTPVPPAAQWPTYATSFSFTPDGSAQKFYRVKAAPAATP